MANIEEIEQWDSGIYQLETTDPVQGGADGVDNAPHKNLANRTLWLKNNKADKNGNAANKFKVANATATDEAVNLAQLNTKANLAGSATQKFKVADGVADDEAVSKLQMENHVAANAVGIGIGQTWQDLTASRTIGVTYTNTTGKPIFVALYISLKQSL